MDGGHLLVLLHTSDESRSSDFESVAEAKKHVERRTLAVMLKQTYVAAVDPGLNGQGLLSHVSDFTRSPQFLAQHAGRLTG